MKRFLILFFCLLSIAASAQVRVEATYNGTSLYSQVASNTYELTLKHPMNGAVGLGVFKTDFIELATGTTSNLTLRFSTDTDTGIYSRAANSLTMFAGGGSTAELSPGTFNLGAGVKLLLNSGVAGYVYLVSTAAASQTPIYTFAGNTNSGLGRNAVGEPSMVASGVEAMRWTKDQTLIGATGSGALPGLAFKDDPDTGLTTPGVNQLGFVSGGLQHAVINANGLTIQNVNGLSMSGASDYAKIHYGAASSTTPLFTFISDTKTGLGRYAVGQPSMVASGVEAMRWTNATTTVNNYFVASQPHYEDLRFSGNGLNLVGVSGAATLNTTNYFGALDFADAAISDSGSIAQMPHGWRNGSSIEPHIHVVNNSSTAGTATFELWYKIASPSGNFPADYTVATLTAYLEGSTVKHQMFDFPELAMTGYGDSTCISFLLRRVGTHASDTLAATAILLEFDLHYINESFGSVNEHGD